MIEYHPSESAVGTHLDEIVDPQANRQPELLEHPEKASSSSSSTDRRTEEDMHLDR